MSRRTRLGARSPAAMETGTGRFGRWVGSGKDGEGSLITATTSGPDEADSAATPTELLSRNTPRDNHQ